VPAHLLGRLTSPAFGELCQDPATIGLVPLGAIEAHGPHLPLETDSLLAMHLAQAAAERVDDPVVIAPVISVGLSDRHLAFPGTITVPPEVLRAQVEAALDAFASRGVERLALISGHGGNYALMRELALARDGADGTKVRAFGDFDRRQLEPGLRAAQELGVTVPACEVHGGALETSLALHLFGDRVGDYRGVHGYTAAEPGWQRVLGEEGSHVLSPIGIVGDPDQASTELGARELEYIVDGLSEWLRTCWDEPEVAW
jgi:creatinine amidohydrolase